MLTVPALRSINQAGHVEQLVIWIALTLYDIRMWAQLFQTSYTLFLRRARCGPWVIYIRALPVSGNSKTRTEYGLRAIQK